MPCQETDRKALGIIAGGGQYPLLMLENALKAGREVYGVGFKGSENPEFAAKCKAYARFRVGSVDGPSDFMKKHGVSEIVFTGQIKPSCIYTLWPDAAAKKILGGLQQRNAHTIYGGVCSYLEGLGFTILPATSYLEMLMPPEGHVVGPAVDEVTLGQAREGMIKAQYIAQLDIGQSLIYHEGECLCVEAFKGTNECIKEGGYRPYSPLLCKISKDGHDMRFDVPCIGIATVKNCHKANIRRIFIEADKCLLLQEEEVKSFCQEQGISIYALPKQENLGSFELRPTNDREHARLLAERLQSLGIGDCAAVCDGVVIAVGDVEGAEKCLRRAANYMKRIRIARLVNWLCSLFFSGVHKAPAPISMHCSASEAPSPSLIKKAKKHRIELFVQ